MKTKIKPNIVFKSVLSKYKDIDKRNEHFNELSDEGKRLEIAWDALNMVIEEKIYPSTGWYWNYSLTSVRANSKGLQNILNNDKFYENNHCEVCQRGAIMLCQIRLGNDIDSNDFNRCEGCEKNLKGFYIEDMLDMESEYEENEFDHPYSHNTREKLANILCNILINGNFNTEDKTDYLIHYL